MNVVRPSALAITLLAALALSACGGSGGIVVDGGELDGFSRPERDELLFSEDGVPPLDDDVAFVVLHATGTGTAIEAFQIMLRDGDTTHFMISPDGRVFQTLDASLQANHTGQWNDRSLSIHLVSPFPAMGEGDSIDPSWLALGFSHAESMLINGVPRRSLVYTEAQHAALIALLEDIDRAYPGLARRVPMTADGRIVPQALVLDRAAGGGPFRGVVAHWHIDPTQWEPGPGVRWPRIQDALEAADVSSLEDAD